MLQGLPKKESTSSDEDEDDNFKDSIGHKEKYFRYSKDFVFSPQSLNSLVLETCAVSLSSSFSLLPVSPPLPSFVLGHSSLPSVVGIQRQSLRIFPKEIGPDPSSKSRVSLHIVEQAI
ncbi:hypothetical protein MUK42_35095 [Musa troglodytarum]|uniref:Uncharacterized protein n=1 Tax=Musa troglodytarum TaxID=320322 RepID=A0A9E7EAF1_9LILI|nr:hypothetical protein MUK42_35095 [Musa troglodytarum]